jgi:hypothetical protein
MALAEGVSAYLRGSEVADDLAGEAAGTILAETILLARAWLLSQCKDRKG